MASLKQKAYNIIKDNIVSCRYKPGQLLNETQLMEECGTSRTPVREALSKLEQEKLVRIVSKKGIMVTELTLKEIGDIYLVRGLLEPQMVKLFGANIPLDELERVRSMLLSYKPEMDMNERNEIDDAIHRLIIESCPNNYFHEWMTLIYLQNQRIRFSTGQLGRYMEKNNQEHLRITETILRADYDKAADLLREHLEKARRATFDTLLSGGSM